MQNKNSMILSKIRKYSYSISVFKKLLTVSVDEYYRNYYRDVLSLRGVGPIAKLTHKSLEFGVNSLIIKDGIEIQEIGAGHGEHRNFVKHDFVEYWETDLRVEPLLNRFREKESDERIKVLELDANNLEDLENASFDRVIATCVLVHLLDPLKALRDLKRIVRTGGVISLYIPCEPGLLLRIARYFATVQNARRLGVNHLHFHYLEHKFYYLFIKHALIEAFPDSKIKKNSLAISIS